MTKRLLTSIFLLLPFVFVNAAAAGTKYNVTVTNVLHGTPMDNSSSAGNTPESLASNTFFGTACLDANGKPRAGEMLGLWVFATHNDQFKLFTLGEPASRELALLSQTGRPFFLASALSHTKGVGSVFTVPASFPPTTLHDVVLCPGESLTVQVEAAPGDHFLSLAAMIFPTNDGFVAVNGAPLPNGHDVEVVDSPAYDSGSEENDELCPNIPSLIFAGFPFPERSKATGKDCPNGLGSDNDVNSDPTNPSSPDNNPLRAEGYVHIHPGIRGVGDLEPEVWNWENPVLRVTIMKIE